MSELQPYEVVEQKIVFKDDFSLTEVENVSVEGATEYMTIKRQTEDGDDVLHLTMMDVEKSFDVNFDFNIRHSFVR